jgi:lysozyme
MKQKGIDVSHWQGNPDFKRVKAAGIQYVIAKATEGVNYIDPCFKTNVQAALSADLQVGAYHFLRAGDITAQVHDFLAAIKPYNITYPAALDIEHAELIAFGEDKLTDMTINFCTQIKAAGYKPMVYSNRNWLYTAKYLDVDRIRAAGISIWLAWYSNAMPDNTDRSSICDMWQYCSDGNVPGISGKVDCNVSYKNFGVMQTAVKIDTTCDVEKQRGEFYTFRTNCNQQPTVTVGTNNVVALQHCRREMDADYWHLCFIGKPGDAAGIYTAAPGEIPAKRFVVKIKEET